MKVSRVSLVNLSENVIYPMSERRCVTCRRDFAMLAFSRQRQCGACA